MLTHAHPDTSPPGIENIATLCRSVDTLTENGASYKTMQIAFNIFDRSILTNLAIFLTEKCTDLTKRFEPF